MDIIKAAKQGDKDSINMLWERYRRYICYIINHLVQGNYNNYKRMTAAGLTLDDLSQEGYFALLDALDHYDISGGYTLLSAIRYATYRRFFEVVGMRTAQGRNDPLTNADRLDRITDDDMTLGETIPDERAAAAYDHIEDDIYYRQLRDTLDSLIATMPPQERETIEGVYYEGKTIARLAREQGKPYCTVRERRQSALRKLRRQSHILRHYIAYDVPDVAYRGGLGAFREHWASATERAVIKIMQVNNTL